MSHLRRYELGLAAVGAFDCAATHTWLCSGVFPTVAWWRICDADTSSRRRLGSLVFGRLTYMAAPRPHFDCLACMVRLAAFWISGIHCRALAAFGRLTFVGCFDAGCCAFRLRCFCALVSENATRGPDCSPIFVAKGSNRVFAMGRIMTKAQVVAALWLRDSSLSVDGEAPFSHFLPARSSSSAIGPHCAIF